jgi:cytochrome c peroxidase
MTVRAITPTLAAAIVVACLAAVSGGGEDDAPSSPREPILVPALRGAVNPGLAGVDDIVDRTGENPTTATWDGRVIVRRCADPDSEEYAEDPSDGPPGVRRGQFWCFHAFRPSLVAVDAGGTPDFARAFGPGFMSKTRHVSHTGGFPVVENRSPAARWNPYRSTPEGTACGVASLDSRPPPCPAERYATYDAFIIHTVGPTNPTLFQDYPDWPRGEGTPTYFEPLLIVVREPETPSASVVQVRRDGEPYPMVADTSGFGFVYDPDDDRVRNPYLYRAPGDPTTTYIGGVVTMEPAATNDGRMVIFNGGDENPFGINLVYTWNATPAGRTGWSPPKNIAYMYWVEGPGSPTGETLINIDGVDYPFSTIFPIAKEPLRDQEGVPYHPGSAYVPASRTTDPAVEIPYRFDPSIAGEHYLGAYPWISWDGRNVMSLSNGRFNVAVVGDLTGYAMYAIDGAVDRTDMVGPDVHEISAIWNLGQWPGVWAQYAFEFEGVPRTVPTRLRDATTWALFEQDHYSEVSFHKTDGSYALYLPMSRLRKRGGPGYADGLTPDVSGRFNTGRFVPAGGRIGFSQSFSPAGYASRPRSEVFGFSGQSVGFLTDAADPAVEPHIVAGPVGPIGSDLTVEGAVFLRTGGQLAPRPWTTIVHQPGSFGLGVDDRQHAWFAVTTVDDDTIRVVSHDPLPTDRWIHITGLYDGHAREVRLYLDAEIAALGPGTGLPVRPATGDLAIGPRNDGASPGGEGLVLIDEVGVTAGVPGVRSPEEIAHSAFRRVVWPTAPLAEWERIWGAGAMPLGWVDADGALLAPIHLEYDVIGDVDAKKHLGEELFQDPRLSGTNPPIACISCHELTREDGGARRGETVSTLGAGRLTRHTPTVFNRVFGRRQFWDGRAFSLGQQVIEPIDSQVEMRMIPEILASDVLPAAGYGPKFHAAFGSPGVTIDRLQEAIVFYESGLVSGNSAIDRHRFLGERLSRSARRGLALFATKARCIGCHPPPSYTDERFHDNAQGNNTDPGRATATGRPRDHGRFRTMSLRDAARIPPYMHDGSIPSLHDVVALYNAGGDGMVAEMKPLGLTPEEIDDLVAFLRALLSEVHVVPLY